MKLVYVFPTVAAKGGVERILVDKMNLLSREPDYEVYLLTYNQGDHPISYTLDERVRHMDLDVRTHVKYRYRGLRRLWEGWKRSHWLRQRLQQALIEICPNMLITVTFGEIALLLQLKGTIPLVVESHGGYDHLIDYPRLTWRHRRDICQRYRLLHRVDAIVTLTKLDAERWQKHYPHVCMIPNLVHLNPTGRLSTCEQKRIIFVGRLAEQKGIPELFTMWQIVHQRHPDWSLDVFGDGDDKSLHQIEGLHHHASVDNIFPHYIESSLLVVTSRWEPFGLIIPEAMSCGIPVVSFEGDGPCSIITDGVDGFIIKERSIEMFADRVCQLIENQELRKQMGKAAVLSAQRYSAEKIMPQWIKLFESLIDKNR